MRYRHLLRRISYNSSHRMMSSFSCLLVFSLLILFSCQKQSEISVPQAVESFDGVTISYHVEGAGDPMLVFVHCWCCNQSFWDEQVPYFSDKYRVVTLDLAGHGRSGGRRENWTIPSFGQDVAAVVRKLDPDQVVLIGHSMGGPVILESARRMPELVIGLVGVDNFQNVEERWDRGHFEDFLETMKADFTGVTRNFVRSMFPPGADTALVEKIAADMSSAPEEVGIGGMEAIFQWYHEDFDKTVSEIKAPLRCINSDLYPTQVDINRKYFPSYEVSFMPGRGHFVQLEDPKTFNQHLERYVEEFVHQAAAP
jgi:pimeloyl-ACP methyl ester carboxylesterase